MQVPKLSLFPPNDPRWFQIIALVSFLIAGSLFFHLAMEPMTVLFVLLTALTTQYLFCSLLHIEKQFLSALITALSIILLVKTPSTFLYCAITATAIASKFLIRLQSRHIFNPSNFAICMFLMMGWIWVRPSQWGFLPIFILTSSLFGLFINCRIKRFDIPLTFLGTYISLLALRVIILGDPWAIFFHQLKPGSLYIFAFYMMTDPKATPDHQLSRLCFSVLVAGLAYILRFDYFIHGSLFYALFICSLLNPLLNLTFKSNPFEWRYFSNKQVRST